MGQPRSVEFHIKPLVPGDAVHDLHHEVPHRPNAVDERQDGRGPERREDAGDCDLVLSPVPMPTLMGWPKAARSTGRTSRPSVNA